MKRIILLFLLAASPAAADDVSSQTDVILKAARAQIGVTVRYDPAYTALPFPNGDVPMDRGVCTDVIIRAYRAVGTDLQVLVNKDMKAAFAQYPRLWGLSRPDPNIDHRRVQNLAVFFNRHGASLPISRDASDYKPGDIVTWRLPDGHPHIGMVSAETSDGSPLMVHNIGFGAKADPILFRFEITGHYRYAPGTP